jgi:hypothetical protein
MKLRYICVDHGHCRFCLIGSAQSLAQNAVLRRIAVSIRASTSCVLARPRAAPMSAQG